MLYELCAVDVVVGAMVMGRGKGAKRREKKGRGGMVKSLLINCCRID